MKKENEEHKELIGVLKKLTQEINRLGFNDAVDLAAPPGPTERIAIELIDLNKNVAALVSAIESANEWRRTE